MPFFTNAFFFVSGYLLFRKQLAPNVISQNISNWMSSWGGALFEECFVQTGDSYNVVHGHYISSKDGFARW